MKPTMVLPLRASRVYPFELLDWVLQRSRWLVECGNCNQVFEGTAFPGLLMPIERMPWNVKLRCPSCRAYNVLTPTPPQPPRPG